MALGLAIIFGLMGVINMAHGELMALGAYATFLDAGLVRGVSARALRLLLPGRAALFLPGRRRGGLSCSSVG